MSIHSDINGLFEYISFFLGESIPSRFSAACDVSAAQGKDCQSREGHCVLPSAAVRAALVAYELKCLLEG